MRHSTSFRGKRLERKASEHRRGGTLNLVSLMDIFTILVFFLLVNSAAVEVLPTPQAMTLPRSTAEERGREVPVVMVTREQVLLQHAGRTVSVARLEELADDERGALPALRAALRREVDLLPIEGEETRRTRGELNIMADKATPFATLKRVMQTATAADFANISLTVLQSQGGGQGGT